MRKLLLCNADVHTLAEPPRCTAVVVAEGRIIAAGNQEVVAAHLAGAELIDCGGRAIVPAFIDPHVHLLAFATAIRAIDCSPRAVRDLDSLLAAIAERAGRTPPGVLLRAAGYRETELAERRHPSRRELDAATGDHPLRLVHGSGHASVLNSAALALAGIDTATEAPGPGEIGRSLEDGEPNGLFLELEHWLDDRLPSTEAEEIEPGMIEANRILREAGIVAVQDLGEHNDAASAALIAGLRRRGLLEVEAETAFGLDHFRKYPRTLQPGALVKLVIRELGGSLEPELKLLTETIVAVGSVGGRVAIHAVSAAAVSHAVTAFEAAQARSPAPGGAYRLEHASICPPPLQARIARLGLTVVSNPGFLHESGDRYLRELDPAELPYLYDTQGLTLRGVSVAAASDAPYSTPSPLQAMAAAVKRVSATGAAIPGGRAELGTALAAHTLNAALAIDPRAGSGVHPTRGSLAEGLAADLVVLSCPLEGLAGDAGVSLEATMYGGRWYREPGW